MASLFLVATPIGNLEDVTLRALRVLGEATLVLAEDTRHTRILLDRHGLSARPLSLHAHNEASRVGRVLEALGSGADVALVTDAGTPLVSDPGARIVAAALEAGHDVVPVPGASAPIAALTASGLPAERFSFEGFLPRRHGERRARLEALRDRDETLVFFESPRRLAGTLTELVEVFGDRRACVARELTKIHEELARGTLAELAQRYAEGARGEVTLVVSGRPDAEPASDEALDAAIRDALESGASARDVATAVARSAGRPKREVYARVVALRGERDRAR